MREKITFVCLQCKMENYIGRKNKRNHPERIEIKKYCPKCNAEVMHKEKK